MVRKQARFTIILLGIIAVGIIVLAAGITAWHQQITKVKELEKQKAELDVKNSSIVDELKLQPAKEQRNAELDLKLHTLDSNMVDYKYIPTYLRQLQATAKNTNNTIRSIRPQAIKPLDFTKSPLTKDAAGLKTTPPPPPDIPKDRAQPLIQGYGLEIEGSYTSLLQFLDALRAFPKMVYVRSVNLSPRATQFGEQRIAVRIETYAIIVPQQYKAADDEKTANAGVK